MSRRNIEVNRWGGCLHLRWRSGLHLPQPKMLEDLFDHFPIFDEGDDSHLTLAFGSGQGINLILTRFADDWVVTCKTRVEAKSAIATARKILAELGVVLHAEKSRIVHVRQGFEFLGYKVPPEALPENVEAMTEAVLEYGKN